ncbi:MAG: hypothetical protein KGS72_25330 [Cyanobacteria bacterium REEB67]|nr:hypothetical protein [Cyanobacteria bacterium REEB67]
MRLRLKSDEAIRVLDRAAALYPQSVSAHVLRSDTEKARSSQAVQAGRDRARATDIDENFIPGDK